MFYAFIFLISFFLNFFESSLYVMLLCFFLNLFIVFIHFFLAALRLHSCVWAFSSCGERGLLFIAVRGLLTAVASLVAEHRL